MSRANGDRLDAQALLHHLGADDRAQLELLGAVRALEREEGVQGHVLLRSQENFAAQLDRPDLGMQAHLLADRAPRDIVQGPQSRELRAAPLEVADQGGDLRVAAAPGECRAQLAHVTSMLGSTAVQLDRQELARIDAALPVGSAQGDRNPAEFMDQLDSER